MPKIFGQFKKNQYFCSELCIIYIVVTITRVYKYHKVRTPECKTIEKQKKYVDGLLDSQDLTRIDLTLE